MAGRATLACLLCALLDSLARVAALRESLAFEDVEEELRSEEESNAPWTGTHVCCIKFLTKGRNMKVDFNVFHESASHDIKKCHATMITGVTCSNHNTCLEECKQMAENDRYYHVIMDKQARKNLGDRKVAAHKIEQRANQLHQARLAGLEKAYQTAALPAKQELEKAQADLQQAKEDYNATQQKIEEMEAKLKELPGEIEGLEQQYLRKQEGYNETEANASYKLKEEKLNAEEKLAERQEFAQKKLEEAEEMERNYTAKVEATHEQLPPTQCKAGKGKTTSKYSSVDCCCVINGVPMKVHPAFKHWDLCKNPRAYKDAPWHAFSCKDFQECDPCRQLSCGKQMCPGA